MISLFYITILSFIWNDLYYMLNKHRLNINFKNRDIESTTILDLAYYFTKLAYWIWIIIGLFSNLSPYFIVLFSLVSIKLITFKLKKRSLYVILDIITPVISILILSVLLFIRFTS